MEPGGVGDGRPGWIGHLVMGLGTLALAVVFLVSPTRTGIGRWVIPAAWMAFAAYYLWRSLRFRRDALARDAAWRRWQKSGSSASTDL